MGSDSFGIKYVKIKGEIPSFSDFTVIWRHSSVDKLQELFGSGLDGFFGALHDQRLKENSKNKASNVENHRMGMRQQSYQLSN